jgi:hypothetical protein
MFDRAWRGLKSQGWAKSQTIVGGIATACVYLTKDGRRCAWGWVDPEGTSALPVDDLSVASLRDRGIGLAATLSLADVGFARRLQNAHDAFGGSVEDRMRLFATEHKLTIPGEHIPNKKEAKAKRQEAARQARAGKRG